MPKEMKNKWLVLVGDPETDTWSVAVNSNFEKVARTFEDEMVKQGDTSPRIVIYTGDFLQV